MCAPARILEVCLLQRNRQKLPTIPSAETPETTLPQPSWFRQPRPRTGIATNPLRSGAQKSIQPP